jgi:hypothetical protein
MATAFSGFVHRRRRGAELVLLVLSLVVGIGAYAAVGLGAKGQVPPDIFGYGGWLVVLVVAAHLTIRFRAPYADPIMLPIISALNGLGLALIHRVNLAQDSAPPAHTQLTWMTLGVIPSSACSSACTTTAGCRRSPTPPAWSRSCCWCCRCCPASAPASTAPASGSTSAG